MIVETAHITSPKAGEKANGDAALIRQDERGSMLLAVVDGLGHGPIAAEASTLAMDRLALVSLDASIMELMQDLHACLRQTRGAAATLCIVRQRQVEACAVGNVQLSCANGSVPLVVSPGVLGHRVPKFRSCKAELKPGIRLALSSDGISTRFRLDEFERMKPADACKAIIARYRKQEDDATILIADTDG